MSLDNFYRLRQNFIILGLTGKMQSGVDKVVDILTQEDLTKYQVDFLNEFKKNYSEISDSESRKIRRLVDFFKFKNNWVKFDVVDYKNVILLFILHYNYNSNQEVYAQNICSWINSLGNYKQFITPRFGNEVGIAKGSGDFISNNLKKVL